MRLLLKAKTLPFVPLDLDPLGHSEYSSIDICFSIIVEVAIVTVTVTRAAAASGAAWRVLLGPHHQFIISTGCDDHRNSRKSSGWMDFAFHHR
jgi:hypothetical protein